MNRMQRILSVVGAAFFLAGIVVTVGVFDLPTPGVKTQSSDLPTTVADDGVSGSSSAAGTEDKTGATDGE